MFFDKILINYAPINTQKLIFFFQNDSDAREIKTIQSLKNHETIGHFQTNQITKIIQKFL
jgi:hypothetical protein